jgi:hypothetical protein
MNEAALIHPQWVGDRAIWIGDDVLHKIQFGDTVRGWEGDVNLAVYWNPHLDCFELMRWENGDYSLVARQKPGVVFDERIIDELVARDMRRKDRHFDLHAEVVKAYEAVEKEKQDKMDEMIAEEVAPRLRRSLIKEDMI